MIITREQLRAQAKYLILTRWTYSQCPVCDYDMHFRFDASGVIHDAGCTCADVESIRQKYMPSSYQDVADVYNNLKGEDKDKAIKFWRLNENNNKQQEHKNIFGSANGETNQDPHDRSKPEQLQY